MFLEHPRKKLLCIYAMILTTKFIYQIVADICYVHRWNGMMMVLYELQIERSWVPKNFFIGFVNDRIELVIFSFFLIFSLNKLRFTDFWVKNSIQFIHLIWWEWDCHSISLKWCSDECYIFCWYGYCNRGAMDSLLSTHHGGPGSTPGLNNFSV